MNTWVTSNDPRDFGKLPGYFDAIVVDAPCSGSGLFRKDARALEEWSQQNVALCGQRQQRILADVWLSLKAGGVLLYATCSYSPEEDEQILDWLAASLEAENIDVAVPGDWGIKKIVSPGSQMTGYRFFPHRLQGEGFFIAAVRKAGEPADFRYPKFKTLAQKQVAQQAAHLLGDTAEFIAVKTGEAFAAILPAHEQDLHALSKAVYLRKTGLELGSPSSKEWLPAHDVALSTDISAALPRIDADKEQALRFLKKEDAGLPAKDKGWYQVSYEGLGLGWVKSLGNRYNNYLPKHWRIRMDISDADWA
jgi:NOL1/NOP2/fmu family ribosome biogenesis protein